MPTAFGHQATLTHTHSPSQTARKPLKPHKPHAIVIISCLLLMLILCFLPCRCLLPLVIGQHSHTQPLSSCTQATQAPQATCNQQESPLSAQQLSPLSAQQLHEQQSTQEQQQQQQQQQSSSHSCTPTRTLLNTTAHKTTPQGHLHPALDTPLTLAASNRFGCAYLH